MIGALFRLGEQKVRPNVYVRWYNAGEQNVSGGSMGIAAAIVKANWGPLNQAIKIDANQISQLLGTNEGTDVVREIFRGGARNVLVVRVGTGGQKGQGILKADATTDAVNVTTKYPTSRTFKITIREALNADEKEFILYEDNKQVEILAFDKGANEVDNLVNAINESSQFLDCLKVEGATTVATVIGAEVSGGANPTITAEDYVNAFNVIELKFFDGICIDTEDIAIQTSLQAFVQRKLQEGFRVKAFIGGKISVPFPERIQNARSFNDFATVYIGNGFETSTGGIDGAKAAARVLGMDVAARYKSSLTKKLIQGSVGVYGELTPPQYNEAAANGMMVFSEDSDGFAQIDYGINTLISVTGDLDEGWKKIRRVNTRYELIDRIAYSLAAAMRNEVDNDGDGRQHVITIANGIINDMILERGLESGQLILDPDHSAIGDSAWYKFEDLIDLDGIEKLYIAFGFKY